MSKTNWSLLAALARDGCYQVVGEVVIISKVELARLGRTAGYRRDQKYASLEPDHRNERDAVGKFKPGDAVEIIANPMRRPYPANMWERVEYIEVVQRGRYAGWHWTRSSNMGQVCVPSGRIRKARPS